MRLISSILRRFPILMRWRFAAYTLPYAFFTRVLRVPVHPQRIVFLSDSRSDFSGNFAFLVDELKRQAPDADVIGILKPRRDTPRRVRDVVRLPWIMATSQTIVLDDFYPIVYPVRIRPETKLVQVWHAAGAFKRVGWARQGLPGGPQPGSIIHKNYTDATVSAENIRQEYADSYGIDVQRVHALGVPRTDVFFDEAEVRRANAAVRARYDIGPDTKIVMIAPTFRGNGQLSAHFDYDSIDWDGLADDLGDDWVVFVKMHPFVPPLTTARPALQRIVDVSGDREITELLMASDVLVTDYSSTIFEFALLRRPMVFFCPDLEEYTAGRDFYRPFEQYVTGPLVHDGAGLADAIRSARADDRLDEFLHEFMDACDGRSTERIVREVLLRPRREAPRAVSAPPSTANTANTPRAPRRDRTAFVIAVAIRLGRMGLSAVYAVLKLLPQQRKIVMISREPAAGPDDFVAVRQSLRRLDPSAKVIMYVRPVPAGLVPKLGFALTFLAQLFHIATAQVLVVERYSLLVSGLRHRDGLSVVQLWHALGAFKKVGRSVIGQAEGHHPQVAAAMRMHTGYDVALISGEACRPAFAEAFGMDAARFEVCPLPRVDRLRDPAVRQQTRDRILAAHPHLAGRRIALYAPTFRGEGDVPVDAATLAGALERIGVHLVVKLHPLMDQAFAAGVDTAAGFTTQEMLAIAELFITDYSSALFEAAVVGLPSYFLAPDLDAYLGSRDVYLDYRHDLPGPIVGSVGELVAAVEAGTATREDAEDFCTRWVCVPEADRAPGPPESGTTPCADRIAQLVVDRLR